MSEQVGQTISGEVRYQPKVTLGICSYITVDVRFMAQMQQMAKAPWYYGSIIDTAKPIDVSRNNIVTKFLIDQPEATHLLMLDNDVLVPPNGIEELLAMNQPIVSGLIVQKMPPFYPLMNLRIAPETYRFAIRWPEDQLVGVDAVGMGCVLLRRDALQKVDPPWFKFANKQSEDYYYCEKAQAAGMQILVNTRVKCGHIGDHIYTVDDFLAHQKDELDKSNAMGVNAQRGHQ